MGVDKQAEWQVDLDEGTATHTQGWVFKFYLAGGMNCNCCEFGCIASPPNVIIGNFPGPQQLAYEAAEAYFHALQREA